MKDIQNVKQWTSFHWYNKTFFFMHTLSLPQDGYYQQENCKLTNMCKQGNDRTLCMSWRSSTLVMNIPAWAYVKLNWYSLHFFQFTHLYAKRCNTKSILKGFDDGILHTWLPSFWTLSTIYCSTRVLTKRLILSHCSWDSEIALSNRQN